MPIFNKPSVSELKDKDKKKDVPAGLWNQCKGCGENIHLYQLRDNLYVCPQCDYHWPQNVNDRLAITVDPGTFKKCGEKLRTVNPLEFKDYEAKVEKYLKQTDLTEAVVTGSAKIGGYPVFLGIMDFRFLGASMGSVVGERITRAIEDATASGAAIILFSASGGARMHEGILSLMQMAKTSGALARHSEAGLPYISVLTHPTTGGVTASFATLGDIILAEPGCMIGFAGPRVVKETTHQNLPPGFQTAEFMMQHGLVDSIVERKDMREQLIKFLGYLMPDQES